VIRLPDLTRIDEFIVIADLHMGVGPDPATGTPDPDDAFLLDRHLIALIDHIAGRADRERVCVVVLGDMVDLLLVEPSFQLHPDARTATTLRRLDQIAAGHHDVIRALGNLVRAGAHLVIVPGDRDIELVRESTQHRLATLIVPGPDEAAIAARARIGFSPWALHVPGLLWAEHGSQFRDVDAFETFAAPWMDGNVELVNRPVGGMVTLLRAARRARMHGMRVGRLGVLPTAAGVGAALVRRCDPRHVARRRAYRARTVHELAGAMGLPPRIATEIDRLAEHPCGAVERRVVGRLVARRLGRPVADDPGAGLRRAARSIHALLAAAGSPVHYVVMGHTHGMEYVDLPAGGAYLNPGAWATQPSGSRESATEPRAGAAVIRCDHADKSCTAELVTWPGGTFAPNDGAAV
jgi:UDP-2,3-diacylglucosamine pyrophosphatase LpxH